MSVSDDTDSLSIIGTVIIDIIKNKTDMFTSLRFSNENNYFFC